MSDQENGGGGPQNSSLGVIQKNNPLGKEEHLEQTIKYQQLLH